MLPRDLLERARIAPDGTLEWPRSAVADVVDALATAGVTVLLVEGRACDSSGRLVQVWQAGRQTQREHDPEYLRRWATEAVAKERWAEWIRLVWTGGPHGLGVREPRRPTPGEGSGYAVADAP